MATRYAATIRHHSIARAHVIDAGDTLTAAKRKATREFGDGFLDHMIVVLDRQGDDPHRAKVVASRTIGARRWVDHEAV